MGLKMPKMAKNCIASPMWSEKVQKKTPPPKKNKQKKKKKSGHFGAIYILRGIFAILAIFGHFLPLTPAQYLKIKPFEINSITWQQKYNFLEPVIF